MGREIRRVPADWVHPKGYDGKHKSLHDNDFQTVMDAWIEQYVTVRDGGKVHQYGDEYAETIAEFVEFDPPPDPQCYRQRRWTEEEATAFQVYQTVSEGTPLSPVFEEKEDLIDWLVNDGTWSECDWPMNKLSRKAAERFVEAAWAPSFMISSSGLKANAEIYEED